MQKEEMEKEELNEINAWKSVSGQSSDWVILCPTLASYFKIEAAVLKMRIQ